jgi:uncharacterized protein YkwD
MVKHANRRKETLNESNITTSSSKESSDGRRCRASMPLLSVTSVLLILVVLLSACGSSSAPTSQATSTSTSAIKKHDTGCTPQATIPSNVADPPAAFDSGANVITNFNFARQQEGCTVSLNIDPTAYDAATPQMQMLLLFNAERQDRGLPALQLDSALLSQVSQNHSKELAQYNYFAHPSPINQPGGKNDSSSRITVNPAINGHNTNCCAEIIAGGQTTAASAVYGWMYQDADSSWGHRQNILGFNANVDANPGHYTWVGIGIATGGKFGVYYTADFLEDSAATPYTPPTTADTQTPTLKPPTVVDAKTVQVTGVQDNSDGGTSAAGVTSVVFYVSTPVDANGNFQTVVATLNNGTWTAALAVTDPTTLHVVVVDGSGNYTDCVAGGTTC